jgi:hypothetical protein
MEGQRHVSGGCSESWAAAARMSLTEAGGLLRTFHVAGRLQSERDGKRQAKVVLRGAQMRPLMELAGPRWELSTSCMRADKKWSSLLHILRHVAQRADN